MPKHEYYEELSALLPIGQLSAEEFRELAEHLTVCSSCRRATDDFSAILDKLPVEDLAIGERNFAALQRDSYRDRFVKRALANNVPFSRAVTQAQSPDAGRSRPRILFRPVLAAVATVVIALLCWYRFSTAEYFTRAPQHSNTRATEVHVLATAPRGKDSTGNETVSVLRATMNTLEKQIAQQQVTILALKTKLNDSRTEAETANRNLSKTTGQLALIKKDGEDRQRVLDSEREDSNRVRSDKDRLDAVLAEQQMKITELMSQVKEKEALAERERELNGVAKDARELMGARNLHILDVSDVDGNGRSKRSFGRVFLVEGRSLLFYAFDLGDRGNPAKVSFQAWGQWEGQQTAAKDLGVFYVDDHAQKRWVLKVNDPDKLSAINSVFVTVEPLGGVHQPTGKKLLYAYLGTQANHP